jgi:hypothetical protein
MSDRYQDDYGQTLSVTTTGMALGTATGVRLLVRLPNNLLVVWTPSSVVGEVVNYVFEEGDLSQSGLYHGEVEATYADARRVSTPFTLAVAKRV